MNKHILEKMQIVGGVTPVDLKTGANSGDWVSLKNYGRVSIVLYKGIGTSTEDPTLVLQQASAVAGTGSKTLAFARIDYKVGSLLSAIGTFTTANQTAIGSYVGSGWAANETLAVIDIKAEDLDRDNGFDCVRCTIADIGSTAQLGAVLYLLHEPRYATVPLPTGIED